MPSIVTEHKHCRWCGRMTAFRYQLVLGGGVQLVAEQKCIAADRVLADATCEASQISHESSFSRRHRGRR